LTAYELTSASGPGTIERQIIPELVKPYARTAFHALRGAWPRLRLRVPRRAPTSNCPPIYIIGCGRSGTTLLGELFGTHPMLTYVHEPYHLWAAVEPMTDFMQLYAQGRHHCLLAEGMVTPEAQRRFRRLFSVKLGSTLVEKSPINTMRIGYLNAISPQATFVHIVRDGIEVARSIEHMAMDTRRMAFRPPRNAWWGVGDVKWSALVRDGRAAGYYPDEVGELATDAQFGAYEWLVSILEVHAWRARLGPRLVELRYQDLTDQPSKALKSLTESLSLTCPVDWVEQAAARVRSARSWQENEPLRLPDHMRLDFNDRQVAFNFEGRASELELVPLANESWSNFVA
jgi:hypothetical protein